VLMLCCFLQEGQETGCHEVDLGNVCAVDVVPVFESGVFVLEHVLFHFFCARGFGVECGGADAGVVD